MFRLFVQSLVSWNFNAINRKISRAFQTACVIDQRRYQLFLLATETADLHKKVEQYPPEFKCSPPLFSILVPVYNVDPEWLRRCLESVRGQTFPWFEICIADDGSALPALKVLLETYTSMDKRFKVAFRPSRGGISACTNTALDMAVGRYIILLDHDDELAPSALGELATVIAEDPHVDMLYSDEDLIGVNRCSPNFKPDWSPDYLESCMYVGHICCYRTSMAKAIGGFRSLYDGAQDYDFVLRFTDETERIRHIPRILYHWRVLPNSLALSSGAKDYSRVAGKKALEDHLKRIGSTDNVVELVPGCMSIEPGFCNRREDRDEGVRDSFDEKRAGHAGCMDKLFEEEDVRPPSSNPAGYCKIRVGPALAKDLSLSFIVDGTQSTEWIESWFRQFSQGLKNFARSVKIEIIFVAKPSLSLTDSFPRDSMTLTQVSPRANVAWAQVMNDAVKKAKGHFLVFLDSNLQWSDDDALLNLLGTADRPQVGAVGPKLVCPDENIFNAGITMHHGLPIPILAGYPMDMPGYAYSAIAKRTCLALSFNGLTTRKEVFDKVGGFAEPFEKELASIDYCLRLKGLSFRSVFVGRSRVYMRQMVKSVSEMDCSFFQSKWSSCQVRDPYYSERLQSVPANYTLP